MTRGAKQLAQLFNAPKQREVAKRLQIHEAYLSRLISGAQIPSMVVAGRIQQELGIPVQAWVETV